MKNRMKIAGRAFLCMLKIYIFMMLSGFILGLPVMGIASYYFHTTEMTETVLLTNVGNFGTIVLAYFWYKWNRENMFEDCEIRKTSKSFIIKSIILGLCFLAVSSAITYVWVSIFPSITSGYQSTAKFYEGLTTKWYYLTVPILAAPIGEEFLCRGLLLHRLKRIVNYRTAIILQAIFFGFLHGNLLQFPYTFLLGLACGYLVYCSNSIIPGIILHMVNNAAAFFLSDILSSHKQIGTVYLIIAPMVLVYVLKGLKNTSNKGNVFVR